METLAELQKYLVVGVGEIKFGIDLLYVREVFLASKIIKLPRTSNVLAGIVNLRGSIISIFDFHELVVSEKKLDSNVNKEVESKKFNIVLLTLNNQDIGLLVDHIFHLVDSYESKSVAKKKLTLDKIKADAHIDSTGTSDKVEEFYIINIAQLLGRYLKEIGGMTIAPEEDYTDGFDFDQYTLPDDDTNESTDENG